MNESKKSSLVRGKPAWRARYMRFVAMQIVYSIAGLGVIVVLERFDLQLMIRVFFGLFLVGQVLWWIALVSWLKGYCVGFFSYTKMLLEIDGVPCPSCLYSICRVENAKGEKHCPECGCSVDGVEAMEAWKKVPKLKIPKEWDVCEQQ
jgi:hypothetical protein